MTNLSQNIRYKCLNSKCNRIFCVPPSRASKTKVKFCSNECKWSHGRVKLTCKQCKRKFILRRSLSKNRMFCSNQCKIKHYRCSRVLIECKRCGKKLSVNKHRAKTIKFCSSFCFNQYRSKDPQGNTHPYTQPCKNCGKSVQRYPSQFRGGRGRFCSIKCRSKHRSKIFMEERIKRNCLTCKKEFLSRKSRVKYGEAKFCSKACANKGLEDHEIHKCIVCETPFKTTPYRIKQENHRYCSDFCRILMWNINHLNRGIYTPEFLRFLGEADTESCPFPPLCSNPRVAKKTRTNPWRLCIYHAKKVNHAVWERHIRRQRILEKEDLMINPVVPETQHHHKEVATC